MALFKRKDLESKGLTTEQIDWIMTESGRALSADYMPKSSLQDEIDKAMKEAGKGIDITTNPEYLAVASERDMLRAINGKEYESIKPKFREQVYNMVSRKEGAEPVEKQLETLKKDYEEYFIKKAEANEPQQKTPQFGSSDTGRMPSGEEKPTFESLWGFKKSNK